MRRIAKAELALSLGIAAVGVFAAFETLAIEVSPSYARIGPRVFPWVVAIGLSCLGIALAVSAWRGRWYAADAAAPGAADEARGDAVQPSTTRREWRGFLLISLGFALYVILIERGGFLVASALLFAAVARAFGSRRPWRDTAIGLALAAVVYVAFDKGLDLELPAGVLQGALP